MLEKHKKEGIIVSDIDYFSWIESKIKHEPLSMLRKKQINNG